MRKLSVRVTCPKFHCWGWRVPDSAQVKLTPQPEPLPHYSTQWSPGPHSRETPWEELRWQGGYTEETTASLALGLLAVFCQCEARVMTPMNVYFSSLPPPGTHHIWSTEIPWLLILYIMWSLSGKMKLITDFFQFLSGRWEFYHLTTNTPQIPFWNV